MLTIAVFKMAKSKSKVFGKRWIDKNLLAGKLQKKNKYVDISINGEKYKIVFRRRKLDPKTGFCNYGNELSDSITTDNFLFSYITMSF